MRRRNYFDPKPGNARFYCGVGVGKMLPNICTPTMLFLGCWMHCLPAFSQTPAQVAEKAGTAIADPTAGNSLVTFAVLQQTFDEKIFPLLQRHCNDCHNANDLAGDLDLARFRSLDSIRQDPSPWSEVVVQVESGEMPPASDDPLSDNRRSELLQWIDQYLRAEAYAAVGDPGPSVLRRLSNAETNYSIRDLTGIVSLDPTAEFPPDGAAGEGFTNASAALGMSPALFAKYLEAGKKVAEHLVLIPDGIEFSAATTSRDWSEEKMEAIRALYGKYSVAGSAIPLNLQGVQFASNDAGVIPLDHYLRVLVEHREQLRDNPATLPTLASRNKLSPKYLRILHRELTTSSPSRLFVPLQNAWLHATVEDVPKLVDMITAWQERLWKFSPVGHIGKRDGPAAWQETVSPLTAAQTIELLFEPQGKSPLLGTTEIFLAVSSPDELKPVQPGSHVRAQGNWHEARIVLRDGTTIPLEESASIAERTTSRMDAELSKTENYLLALAAAYQNTTSLEETLNEQDSSLQPDVLQQWANAIQLAQSGPVTPTGHYTERLTNIGGYEAIRGWGSQQTPSIIVNQAENEIQFSTLRVPGRSVAVHPSPSQWSILQWQAPQALGQTTLQGLVADDDPNCGNGVQWRVEHQSRKGTRLLTSGAIENGGRSNWEVTIPFDVSKGDLIRLVIDPKNGDHSCDTTQIEFRLTATAKDASNAQLTWDMTTDLVDRILESNPLPDRTGNPNVWHYGSQMETPPTPSLLVPESTLTQFRDAVVNKESQETIAALASIVAKSLTLPNPIGLSPADQNVHQQVRDWLGPMGWLQSTLQKSRPTGKIAPIPFQVRQVQSWSLPNALVAGGKLLATATLSGETEADAVAQPLATLKRPTQDDLQNLRPSTLLVRNLESEKHPWVDDIDSFRAVFPAALCYSKIVPIDEVVTLQLLYREDEPYQRLMLSELETSTLDRLWDQLRFISQEPLKLVDAYEQLWQYATQDADPSAFEPLRAPIQERAEQFRKQMLESESPQLQAVIQFASRAWRRPLAPADQKQLKTLYQNLREDGLSHSEAIRLTFASTLASAKFLYRFERQSGGSEPTRLDDHELATRLSYFLWSSIPDDSLRSLAMNGKLTDHEVLRGEVTRLLSDPKVRRLAIEFGCQWLGVRDFDQLDEKSEIRFPEFIALRDDMYEETILFFTDFFQNDRSILSLLEADHTFANHTLAEFYQIPDVPQDGHWHRIEGLRAHGRGGILGLATTLAKYSGASRTSAILRGNWIYESLLGMHLPKPPSGVPPLPETLPEGLSERALIELHSTAPDCARCHEKIDPYGFALESFDAIGRYRPDADPSTELLDGTHLDGLDGLREFLAASQRERFVRQFCRKLLGFALGRTVHLGDEPLLDSMVAELAKNDYRISTALTTIVSSPQFQMIRGTDVGHSPPKLSTATPSFN